MLAVDLGFRPDHLLTASYSLPEQQYITQSAVDEFNHELLRRIQQLPGVKFVGLTSFLPASGGDSNTVIDAEGYVAPKAPAMNLATQVMVEGDSLQAIGVPLLAGRYFTPADTADTQLVAIVNHKLAEHCWPGANPVGKHLRLGVGGTKIPWLTVVGEVADVKESSPDAPSKQQYYTPVEQYEKSIGPFASPTDVNETGGSVVVRTATEPDRWPMLREQFDRLTLSYPSLMSRAWRHALQERISAPLLHHADLCLCSGGGALGGAGNV